MGEQMADSRPLLPRKKPWWIAVLFGMVLFGYLQEDAKIKLNHYTDVGARYGDFYTYGFEDCDWDAQCMYEARKGWWDRFAPLSENNFYVTRDTFDVFHWWGAEELLRAKWILMVAILLGFFSLDALFLRAAGVGDRWKLLLMNYAASGLVVAFFWLVDGRGGAEAPGYNVAREVLGFLQSPMPSLMLVLLPWLRDRALSEAHGQKA
ncbi:hypothetical protein OAG26_00715 [Flavobacteriales bacterium]|nr:hypothetical protein [Flavobacteriales bacterium]